MSKKIYKKSSLASRNRQKFLSNRLAMVGLILLLVVVLLSVAAPVFTKHDPNFIDTSIRYQAGSSEHILGTDSVGRDLWARLIFGGRYSIMIGLLGAAGASLIAVVLGCVSGYYGGKVDAIIVYVSEIFYSFPQLLLVLDNCYAVET